MKPTLALLTVLLLAPLAALHAADAPVSRPNIVFIFTDDQPQSAMSCMGNQQLKTPNMDRLASEGGVVRELLRDHVDLLREPCLDAHGSAHGAAWHQ
jgi:hypothetical protein